MTDSLTVPAQTRTLQAQILRFALVGVIGFVVNATLVALLSGRVGPEWGQFVAFPAAVVTTWQLNRRYTFSRSGRGLAHEAALYVAANAIGWAANNGVYFALILDVALVHAYPVIAVAAGSLAGMAFNFVTSKWVVFR